MNLWDHSTSFARSTLHHSICMLHHQALLSRPELSQCFHVPVPERRGRPVARRVHNLEKREARYMSTTPCAHAMSAPCKLQHNHMHTTVSSGSHAGTSQQLGMALMVPSLTIVELRHRVGGHRVVSAYLSGVLTGVHRCSESMLPTSTYCG